MEKTWSVVQFEEENSVEAVPSSWLFNNQCYWPPFNKEKLLKFIRNNEEPNTCWPLHPVKVFRNGIYDDYLTARRKCKTAELFSDLGSDIDCKSARKKKPAKVFSPESSPISTSEEDTERNYRRNKKTLPPVPVLNEGYSLNPQNENLYSNSMTSTTPQSSSSSLGDVSKKWMSTLALKDPPISNTKENKREASVTECSCCQVHPGNLLTDVIRKQNILFQYIKEINASLTEIQVMVKNLEITKPIGANENLRTSFVDDFNFPLNNDEDLQRFEAYLLEESQYITVVKEVAKIGGVNMYEFVKRSLSFCISNRFAETYTFYGKNGKKNFSELRICGVLIDAAYRIFKDASKKDIETQIKKWMRRAKERK